MPADNLEIHSSSLPLHRTGGEAEYHCHNPIYSIIQFYSRRKTGCADLRKLESQSCHVDKNVMKMALRSTSASLLTPLHLYASTIDVMVYLCSGITSGSCFTFTFSDLVGVLPE